VKQQCEGDTRVVVLGRGVGRGGGGGGCMHSCWQPALCHQCCCTVQTLRMACTMAIKGDQR
jgi:hypothetical protein